MSVRMANTPMYKIKLTFHHSRNYGRYIVPIRRQLGAKPQGIHIHIFHKCIFIEWEKVYQ